jgi:hypothetical protein
VTAEQLKCGVPAHPRGFDSSPVHMFEQGSEQLVICDGCLDTLVTFHPEFDFATLRHVCVHDEVQP